MTSAELEALGWFILGFGVVSSSIVAIVFGIEDLREYMARRRRDNK